MASYSKTKVDRAGQMLADRLHLLGEGKAIVGQHAPALLDAIEIIDWWRDEHAKPLSRVAANLRYYAAEEGNQ